MQGKRALALLFVAGAAIAANLPEVPEGAQAVSLSGQPLYPALLAGPWDERARRIIRTFEEYLTPTASRFWMLRTDLSHMPGM